MSFADMFLTGLKPIDHQPCRPRVHILSDFDESEEVARAVTGGYCKPELIMQHIEALLRENDGLDRFQIAHLINRDENYAYSLLRTMRAAGRIYNDPMPNRGRASLPAPWHIGRQKNPAEL